MPGDVKSTDISADLKTFPALIQNTTKVSAAVDLKAHRASWLFLPIGYDGGEITVEGSVDGSTWAFIYDKTATYKVVPAAVAGASRYVLITLQDLFGFQYLRFNTNSNVGADRTLIVGGVPRS